MAYFMACLWLILRPDLGLFMACLRGCYKGLFLVKIVDCFRDCLD